MAGAPSRARSTEPGPVVVVDAEGPLDVAVEASSVAPPPVEPGSESEVVDPVASVEVGASEPGGAVAAVVVVAGALVGAGAVVGGGVVVVVDGSEVDPAVAMNRWVVHSLPSGACTTPTPT